MAVKTYKPITPGLRQRIALDNSGLTADKPEKSLTTGRAAKAGRGAKGRISVLYILKFFSFFFDYITIS